MNAAKCRNDRLAAMNNMLGIIWFAGGYRAARCFESLSARTALEVFSFRRKVKEKHHVMVLVVLSSHTSYCSSCP